MFSYTIVNDPGSNDLIIRILFLLVLNVDMFFNYLTPCVLNYDELFGRIDEIIYTCIGNSFPIINFSSNSLISTSQIFFRERLKLF